MSEPRPAATGIVLAGGRSTRFGRDKLAEPVRGRPLLEHAVAAVADVATEIVIVVARGSDPTRRLGPFVADGSFRIVEDSTDGKGPLEGLRAGLAAARETLAIVVGGDMPDLVPAVLDALLRALADSPHSEATVLAYRGRRQQLPVALRTAAAAALVENLIGTGERRLGIVLERLVVCELPAEDWLALDPGAASLRDVDVPEDLEAS